MKSVNTVYFNDDPNGIRISRLKLSHLTAFVVPRNLLSEAKIVPNINNSGVYYLINDEDSVITEIYVGQTKEGIKRLDDHNRKKIFWNKAILFLSSSEDFDSMFLDEMEKYAIDKAKASNRYKTDNQVDPKIKIRDNDLPYIEKTYDEIKFLMATFGYKLDSYEESIKHINIVKTSRRGVVGIGAYSREQFELLEGSEIDLSTTCLLESYNAQRNKLVKEKIIVEEEDKFILKKTLVFKTPSGASDFVLGGSTNGWKEWKDNQNKTLDELYR